MTLKAGFLTILATTVSALVVAIVFGIETDVMFGLIGGGIILSYVTGVAFWASAKGYHPLLGVVCAWFGVIGLLCLALSSNQSKTASRV